MSKNKQTTFNEPDPDGAFFAGPLHAFSRSLAAAFMFASTDETRPHLAQVVLGRFHDRLCLVATDGHALVVHWLEASESSKIPRGKRELQILATLSWSEWRMVKGIIAAAHKQTLGRVIITGGTFRSSLTVEMAPWGGFRGQRFTVECDTDQRGSYPPIAKVCRPGKETESKPAYVSAPLLERATASMRKHALLFGEIYLPVHASYRGGEFGPVFVHTPYSLAVVMPMRAAGSEFSYGHAFWQPEEKAV